MRFIDEALIKVFGGHGGPGCISFRRETFVPRGGPDGGDGGAGGSIIFKATVQLGTLQDFRFKREYRAPAGDHGYGANKAGRDGEDIWIRIPVGTMIRDAITGELLIDFTEDGQEWVACQGGRGGKGNSHFATSTHQAPRFAQPGEEGTSRELKLELRLLADVAIIGFPNAGKSTFISSVSAAHPKVADYPFTTLTPNLGVVTIGDAATGRTLVFADVPGLIEGAHRGAGLGTRFLKHIERTQVFIHLMDGAKLLEDITRPELDRNDDAQVDAVLDRFVDMYRAIRDELTLYNEALAQKPELVAVNKLELIAADTDLIKRLRTKLRAKIAELRPSYAFGLTPAEPYFVSAVTRTGLSELLVAVSQTLERAQKDLDPTQFKLPDDSAIRK